MAARETLQAMIALPAPVAKGMLSYMGLFRPHQRALSWKKAKKIVDDLAALIAPGWVQVQGKPSRPCPPHIWAQAMEQMVGRADLQRPLRNHNYLRQVVWQLADQADAGSERHQHRQIVTGDARVHRDDPPPAPADDLGQIHHAYIAAHGALPEANPEKAAKAKRLVSDLAQKLQMPEGNDNG